MMSLALLVSFCSLSQLSATDYFPTEPGMKWEYETTGDGAGVYSQAVGGAIDVGGVMRAPLNIIIKNKVTQTTFYQVSGNGVYVLGSEPKTFLDKPRPVFLVDEKGAKWTYEGPSPYEDDAGAKIWITGQSKVVKPRTYLGAQRDCIEVKSETKIGLSDSTATVIKQTAIYAKGLGLAEMEETRQLGRRSYKLQIKLTKFEASPE